MKFKMQERDGTESFIDYDQLTNIIDIPEFPVQPKKFGDFDVQNIGKSRNVNTLKIQMGFACNYSCSYCLQATAALSPEVNVLDDTHTFLRKLDNWLIGSPTRIEFWGGEPLVYWSRLKILVPTLRDKFPDAEFVMITNGSLLNKERNDFIIKYNIGIGLSHDGEAHTKIRGKDPLTDPTTFKWINDLVTRHNDMLSFNCVLSKGNTNFGNIETYIKSFFDVDIHVGLEGVVSTYDDETLSGAGALNKDELTELSNELTLYLINNPASILQNRIHSFIISLIERRPASALGQKCGMDVPENVAVDLKGNITTCQNVAAKGNHLIGKSTDLENAQLKQYTHLSNRDNCLSCPVLQLCQGSCMFLEDKLFDQSCKNEFALNMAFLKAALFMLTGKMLVDIE